MSQAGSPHLQPNGQSQGHGDSGGPRVRYAVIAVITVAILAALFIQRAYSNVSHQEIRDSNFFDFWLAGRMILAGQDPYNGVEWQTGSQAYGSTADRNQVFLYPRPVALLMAPVALMTPPAAYFFWQLLTEAVIALTTWFLLGKWFAGRQRRLFLPIVIALLYFGPVFLSLQLGTIAALSLVVVVATPLLLEEGRSLLAGIVLSLTLIKPSQAVPLIALATVWFLLNRNWRAILGLAVGGVGLILLSLLGGQHWIQPLLQADRVALHRTLGTQSNLPSLAYHVCDGSLRCSWPLGLGAVAITVGLTSYYFWAHRARLSAWDAFNLIVPVAFLTTVYLWSYDQALYVVPIVWISAALVERTRSYAPAFGFLLLIVSLSLIGLAIFAYTHNDLVSLFPTLLVIGLCLWLQAGRRRLTAATVK